MAVNKRTRALKKASEITAAMLSSPVNEMMWVHRDQLHANDYNPNHVAPPEVALLKTSILEDGWTQPIVVRPDGEIVDGFHRWTVAGLEEMGAKYGYCVPVVILRDVDSSHQRMSTIRHNRARGQHGVLKMADIVRELHDKLDMSFEEIGDRLQMEDEEVDRLYDSGGMTERGSANDFGRAWVPGEADETEGNKT